MDYEQMESVTKKALEDIQGDSANVYVDMIYNVLKDKKINNDIIAIVVRGMDIDHGANFVEFILECDNKTITNIWNTNIRNNKKASGYINNYIKLISLIAIQSIIEKGKFIEIRDSVIEKLIELIKDNEGSTIVKGIIKEYIIDELCLIESNSYFNWEKIDITADNKIYFSNYIKELANAIEDSKSKYNIMKWINDAMPKIKEQYKEETVRNNIPQSKKEELQELFEHYMRLEEAMYQVASNNYDLSNHIKQQEEEIARLHIEKNKLLNDISNMKGVILEKEKEIEKINVEIQERKRINDGFEALKENDEKGLLKSIGEALRFEYADYCDTASDEMDLQLGEIYREKIKSIFKILSDKGIKVE